MTNVTSAALAALTSLLVSGLTVANAAASTNETDPDSYIIINGTKIVIPTPESVAKLDVSIKEKNPPIWPFQVYVENHPVGFDITVKNPTSQNYTITIEGKLWNPNPKDASLAISQPDIFRETGFILEAGTVISTEYWTRQLLPGGYVLNVTAFQIYSDISLPGGGRSTTFSASGYQGVSFVVYSEDSRNNLYIAIGTITAASAAFATVIIQSWHGRSTLEEMRRQSQASRAQVNLMRNQLNLERRKKHFERLIEDSLRGCEYTPASSGEMLHSYERVAFTRVEKPVKYLEQAKKHLEAYADIWKLYNDAPTLLGRKEELEKGLEQIQRTIRDDLVEELSTRGLEHRIDVKYVSQTFGDKLWGWFRNRYDNSMPAQMITPWQAEEGELVVDDRPFPTEIAKIVAAAVNAILGNEDLYQKYATVLKELLMTEKKIESNRVGFQSLLEKEVIEKVTVSGYETMLGRCDQCPQPI